jgi:hypothetical protein
MKSLVAENRELSEWSTVNPDKEHRKSIALQAAQLLQGKTKWAPTWQNFEDSRRAMCGLEDGERSVVRELKTDSSDPSPPS